MTFEVYCSGDVVRFLACTRGGAGRDCTAALMARNDIPLCGQRGVAFRAATRCGVSTAMLALVRRAQKDAYDPRFTEDPDEADRGWPVRRQ